MSGILLTRHATAPARPRAAGWLAWLHATLHAIETRHHLAQLDDRMLKDIGVTRSEALEEANRAPWDLSAPVRSWARSGR